MNHSTLKKASDMQTTTNLTQRWLLRGLGVTTLAAFALISACGGGGSVGFDPTGGASPTPTSTATATPTSTPTPLSYAVLHSFAADASEGIEPFSALAADSSGNFYGTTYTGGANDRGTLFSLTSTGIFNLVHSFGSGFDGERPFAALVGDGGGTFYGTTYGGGEYGRGTVYKLAKVGSLDTVTLLHSFEGGQNDGDNPYAALVPDGEGNFYGTSYYGGANSKGTVFKMNSLGAVTVLRAFAGSDGSYPYAGLVADGAGNYYGTTETGGANDFGSVYKISSDGEFQLLHNFASFDGSYPYAALVGDGTGNFYGTTYMGGTNNAGTVFKITSEGVFELLHNFIVSDGQGPYYGPLLLDAQGNLYGTTLYGGDYARGTAFKIKKTGEDITLLHAFGAGNDGANPYAGLVSDGAGNLYGTTISGGAHNKGTVFRIAAQ